MASPKSKKVVASPTLEVDTPVAEADTPVPEADNQAPEVDTPVNGTTAPDAIGEGAIEDTFTALKTLLSTVEKLQKARQNVGDIKPLLIRLLDGEMLVDEELEQVKTGIGGLGKLAKLYGDYQDVLAKAQPARDLLDRMIKPQKDDA
ncbi:MAG: hypothetical protein AAGE59_29550 [Cyanobacteria bacterium P01_F01_bin.86]